MRRRSVVQWPAAGWLGGALGLLTGHKAAWGQPASAAAEEAKAPPLPALGTRLTVPAVDTLNATHFQPSAAQGKPLLLYWWASTCPFCAQQTPLMDALWRERGAKGFQMLGISVDRKPEDALTYLKRKGYTFPSAWASPTFKQALPKPKGLPITVVLGPDGRVLAAERGQLFPEDIETLAALF